MNGTPLKELVPLADAIYTDPGMGWAELMAANRSQASWSRSGGIAIGADVLKEYDTFCVDFFRGGARGASVFWTLLLLARVVVVVHLLLTLRFATQRLERDTPLASARETQSCETVGAQI